MKTRADYERELAEIAREIEAMDEWERRRDPIWSPYNTNLYDLKTRYTKTLNLVVEATLPKRVIQ